MEGVLEVDASRSSGREPSRVFSSSSAQVKEDVAGLRLQPGLLQDLAERDARPLADAAPALDAVVARDLGARRHGAEIGEREAPWAARRGRRP